MNYKVLYRKYRPSSFSQIVGQEYTVEMLQNAIKNDKISHAYLFTGPRGTGKTSTAKIFAKTINCLNPVNGEACGECANCLSFAESPDIIEIDAASNNGVDDIRELINNVKIAPSEGKYKIYIIDEAHMITQSAFNAFLLTLEEPPKHAIFIMATTNVESIPITILSRCQRFNFQKISMDDLKKQIHFVCDEEGIKITDDAVDEIAYLSEGGMRDALSLLDQLASNAEEINIDKILTHYGSISSKIIKDIIKMVEIKDAEGIEKAFNELENSANDYKIFIKRLVQEFTHIAVLIKMNRYEGSFDFAKIKKIIFEFNEVLNKININMNPYILIKLILLGSFEEEQNFKQPILLSQKIEKEVPVVTVEKKIETDPYEEVQVTKYLQELKNIRINNCFYGAKKEFLVAYQNIWKELESSNLSPDFVSWILDSQLVCASKDYVIISTKLESLSNLINTKIDEFTNAIQFKFSDSIHFIALSNSEWEKEKAVYVKNLKNKYSYQLIDESSLNNLKPNHNDDEEIENIVADVFNRDKIEIV